jgi:uncharacterized membrane protein YbhN (UPF0104 family)
MLMRDRIRHAARRIAHGLPLLPVAAVLTWALLRWTQVDAGIDQLVRADFGWLLLASLLTWICYGVGAIAQQGAVPQRLPWRSLVAVQFAAGLANHFSPASTGGGIVNMRYLRRQGLSRGQALSGVALNSAATAVSHTAILVAILIVAPHTFGSIPVHGRPIAIVVAVVAAAVVAGAVLLYRRRRRPREDEHSRFRVAIAELAAVCRDRTRAAQLWGAALATPAMHGLILVCVARAIGLDMSPIAIVLTYLAASGLASVMPSIGAMGALDLTLVAALAHLSGDKGAAVGAVVGYRVSTIWLPLVPSAATMAVLLRRRIL